jgi:hypothetical protein
VLVVTADPGPLPADTRLNVRYGGNPDGEPYALDAPRTPQAVSCEEDNSLGGAGPSAGAAGGEAPDAASDTAAREAMALRPGSPGRAVDVIAAEGRDVAEVQKRG